MGESLHKRRWHGGWVKEMLFKLFKTVCDTGMCLFSLLNLNHLLRNWYTLTDTDVDSRPITT